MLFPSAVSTRTPESLIFGAGTIHFGLEYDPTNQTWNFEETIVGATMGGSKLTITPNFVDVEVDQALVKVIGLTLKQGETATLETTLVECEPSIIAMAVSGVDIDGQELGEGEDRTLSKVISDPTKRVGIPEMFPPFVENFAYVGKTSGNHGNGYEPIIVIFPFAQVTSGLELDSKKSEAAGTVGLSVGLSPILSAPGKIIIIICMFLGRLSPVTVAVALNMKFNSTFSNATYPEENVIIG